MSVPIIPCPSCSMLLLEDSIQCPSCQHVLQPEKAVWTDQSAPAERLEPEPLEDACPRCGEMVRRGMVRCWNCSAFIKDEIAAAYQQMQSTPSPVMYSVLPEDSQETGETADGSMTSVAEDDDFELAPGVVAGMETNATPAEQKPAGRPAASDEPATAPSEPEPETYAVNVPSPAPSENGAPAAEAAPGGDSPPSPSPAEPDAEQPSPAAESDVAHSVATGGDVLLKIAMEEEVETERRRTDGGRRPRAARATATRSGFLVYCPHGHRVEVQERHRGLTGRCPRCKSPFFVPKLTPVEEPQPAADAPAAETAADAAETTGRFTRWITDVRLHAVNPQKLKLKPGSLENACQPVDVGFAPDGLLVATLAKAGGLFGLGGGKKAPEVREAMLAHLREDKPLEELPVASRHFIAAETVGQIGVAQPALYAHESMFAGVPVFGAGRLAVRLPVTEGGELLFVSLALSEFRTFSTALAELYGIADFGRMHGIPLSDRFTQLTCHYSEEPLAVLENVEFYQGDPHLKLELIGRRCQGCGLVVSEDSRKKEKIGGANGRGIAKAKCPKCQQKFGDVSLYTLAQQPAPAEQTAPAEPPVPAS